LPDTGSNLSTAFLDGMRGLAALYVLFHHAFLFLQPGYRYGYLKHPEQFGIFKTGVLTFSYVFKFGHSAVLFFFVLSGFVVHLRYAKKFAAGQHVPQIEWGMFLFRRARRLYPPLLFALLLTWALDSLGYSLGYSVYFQRTPYPVINANVFADHHVSTLLGNAAFLMNSCVPVWGTDSPLWSLKYEWWFYVLYPACWFLLRRSVGLVTVVVGGLSAMTLFIPRNAPMPLLLDVLSAIFVWWLGALLAEVYVGRLRIAYWKIALMTVLLPVAAIASSLGHELPWPVWGLGFSGLIAACFAAQERGWSLSLLERLRPLGDCSYTLYVIHAPIVMLISGWLMSRSPTGELPTNPAWTLCVLGIIPLAYVAHLLVERPFLRPQPRASLSVAPQLIPTGIGAMNEPSPA